MKTSLKLMRMVSIWLMIFLALFLLACGGGGGGGGDDGGGDGGSSDDYEEYENGTDPSDPDSTPTADAHQTHWNSPKGPNLGSDCTVCHEAASGGGPFWDGAAELASTSVCNSCHSPNGAFDGVNDPTIGAKNNWDNGVYEVNGKTLKAGKEKWCVGCHDDGEAYSRPVSQNKRL